MWWGKGFTEWEIVRNAKPLFPGHLQPKVPAGGYFDLTEEGQIEAQFRLARSHGIDGFVFYHYWYEKKRPLGKPLDLVLGNRGLDVKFSLCWANHSWTRSWRNRAGSLDVLIEQTYEKDCGSRRAHYEFLHRAFVDARYIRVDGKPLFQIYVPEEIPDLAGYLDGLREHCLKASGTGLHVSALVTGWRPGWGHARHFDSLTLLQPALALFSPADIFSGNRAGKMDASYWSARVRALPLPVKKILYRVQDRFFNRVSMFDYGDVWDKLLVQTENSHKQGMPVFPCAFVDFDNTPRYGGRARIIKGFSPESFGGYLKKLLSLSVRSSREGIVFINAWNEWGEGMYLQPDEDFGNARLTEVLEAKKGALASGGHGTGGGTE